MPAPFLPAELLSLSGRAVFTEAAFGANPGIGAAELPAAADAAESWFRAVALGGQGRYAAARSELRRTRRSTRDPILLSLATSTDASLLRQLGWHTEAAVLDGRALARVVAGADMRAGTGDLGERLRAEAVCDALTGLAADALGTARPALAARLLERCRKSLDPLSETARPRVRWHWVVAETALTDPAGLGAGRARQHAERASELAERGPSVRHRVKSRLLLAAATAATGDVLGAATLAAQVAADCRTHGLLPLRWATAMLRSGVADSGAAQEAVAEAGECARALVVQGGVLRSETALSGAA